MQLCEPKIRSLETDNRFTEAHLAIGSRDNPSPLAIDVSRHGSGGVSGPRFLVSGSFGHVRSARHPRMGTTQEVQQGRRRQHPPIFKNKPGGRIRTSGRAAVRQVSGGVSRPIPVKGRLDRAGSDDLASKRKRPAWRAVSVSYVSVLLVWSSGSLGFLSPLPGA